MLMPFVARFAISRSCGRCVCSVPVPGGIARRSSDLDLAISSPEATPTDWAELCDALENTPIIYELDIVRSEQVANKRLKAKIAREGVTIYPEIDELQAWNR